MQSQSKIVVFGEVLFDCFPSGEQVLGGAPFNVAWHLQALGDQPQLVSRVGDDAMGQKITAAMRDWQMDTVTIQQDHEHPTGRVDVNIIDDEPHYNIVENCAYEFIEAEADITSSDINEIDGNGPSAILYHGSLALRNPVARKSLSQLAEKFNKSIFLDVNLRPPWWDKAHIVSCLESARWVKLNEHELEMLGFSADTMKQAIADFQSKYQLDQVILTRGKDGAIVRTQHGELHHIVPESATNFVDTVGAGDAFTAVYIHGLLADWPIADTLKVAQQFASKVVGIRGATSSDPAFYQAFIK